LNGSREGAKARRKSPFDFSLFSRFASSREKIMQARHQEIPRVCRLVPVFGKEVHKRDTQSRSEETPAGSNDLLFFVPFVPSWQLS
jgi:hypothetical protein